MALLSLRDLENVKSLICSQLFVLDECRLFNSFGCDKSKDFPSSHLFQLVYYLLGSHDLVLDHPNPIVPLPPNKKNKSYNISRIHDFKLLNEQKDEES